MKAKKKHLALIISATIIIIAVISIVLAPNLISEISSSDTQKYFDSDIPNVDAITVYGHCCPVDSKANSVAGVKEAIRMGANAVVVDLCFRKDSTPVITDDYTFAEKAESVESLFNAMNEENYKDIKLCLNIVQLSDMSKLNALAVKYNFISRLYIIGIDRDRYGMLTSDDTIIPFFLNYSPDSSILTKDGFIVPECINLYGATGLIIDYSKLDEELIDAFNEYSIPIIVSGLTDSSKMCSAILNSGNNLYVTDISNARKTIDTWTEIMQKRNFQSVKESLNNLSTTK